VNKIILTIGAVAAVAVTAPVAAQSVHRQEHRQEQRIRQGERSGRLTRAEAQHLQMLEARVRRTEARMRRRGGGRLTWRERHRLEQMIRRDNAEIYRLKHNRRGY
jgi:Ni/Co efflux regulator RcnB